jgi:hypothetical protein
MSRHKPGGMRYYAYQQLNEIVERDKQIFGSFNSDEYLSPTELLEERLFGDDTRF